MEVLKGRKLDDAGSHDTSIRWFKKLKISQSSADGRSSDLIQICSAGPGGKHGSDVLAVDVAVASDITSVLTIGPPVAEDQ